ncbi:hypothetical protein ARMGADRAFT_478627 [Armillaria gallica]|uniref:Uncharacterized protein n=1 Tax=Armillaria gallica TaxID=47427 RepID=A0A2H3CUG6_ARMGA|nr:hypothetical protein ARMGADRAFT_478627 [Armillaria gallica]
MGVWTALTREPHEAFLDDVQQGRTIGVADTGVYSKRSGCFMKNGCQCNESISGYLRCIEGSPGRAEYIDLLGRVCFTTLVVNGRANTGQDSVNEPMYSIVVMLGPKYRNPAFVHDQPRALASKCLQMLRSVFMTTHRRIFNQHHLHDIATKVLEDIGAIGARQSGRIHGLRFVPKGQTTVNGDSICFFS